MSNSGPSIFSIFESAAERYKDRTLFNYLDGSWKSMTYGEFRSLAEGIAAELEHNGLRKGDRAAIVSENRPEWCAAYLAIVMCGGVAVPVDMQLGAEEIGNLLGDCGARIVFHSSKTEEQITDAAAGMEMRCINFDATPPYSPPCQGGGGGVVETPFRAVPVAPGEIASIIYTSGTTGSPKGVMLSHGNFCSDADAVIRARVVTGDDNVLSVLPLHHTYPFMCTFLVPLFIGAVVTFSPGLKAADLSAAIREKGVTVVVGVPRLFEMIRNGIIARIKERKAVAGALMGMLRACGRVRRRFDVNMGRALFRSVHENFGRVRFFASGGARLDPSVMEDLEALGFTVLEGYGLTETSPVITFNPPEKRKPGSAGKPLPGVSIRIAEDGEITVRGPMVMQGYYKRPGATAEVLKDGELFTGDIGSMDSEGFLFITGRKKEVIVLSSGKNIYPEDVEKAYMITPLIKELCITGLERDGMTDAVQAVIVPDLEYAKREAIGNVTEVLSWKINEASAKLPEYVRIKGYILHPGPLPRTPLGKLRRFMVREFLEAQRQAERPERGEDAALMADEVGRKVAEAIRELADGETPVRATDNLELDLGFDSLAKVELITSLERVFSISLPDAFITEVQTVGDIVSALRVSRGEESPGEAGAVSWKDIIRKEPLPRDTERISLSYGMIELAVVYGVLAGLKILFRLVFRLRVEGMENVPEKGPFVVTPNHASYLDGFVIAASIPFRMFRRFYFLGLKQFFTGAIKAQFARLAHVIPIDSETYLHKALLLSAYVLKRGMSLCVFPEGGRSFDGGVMPFKKGIGVLALELGVPVVPAYIDGTFRALPRDVKFPRPAGITVTFGKPITPSDTGVEKKAPDKYQAFADALRRKVLGLSDRPGK